MHLKYKNSFWMRDCSTWIMSEDALVENKVFRTNLIHLVYTSDLACTNITCYNGGSCRYINGNYDAVCVCLHGYTGQFCEGKNKLM